MTKKQKKNLKKILIGILLFVIIFICDIVLEKVFDYRNGIAGVINNRYGFLLEFGIYFGLYVFVAGKILKKAFKNIGKGQFLDENFLMAIATIGAFALGLYQGFSRKSEIEGFDEGCAVILFFMVGEWFEQYAVGKSRKNISELMNIRPDFANVYRGDSVEMVDPSEVNVGDIIIVKPGEKIPLDGVIIKGSTTVDTKALTGESVPEELLENDKVISGTVNLTSVIEVKVEKAFYDSTVSKILELVENASNHKSKSENFITKFSRIYTPLVVLSAIVLCVVLGILINFETSIYRALSFLVVSCPCALVISIPLSFFAGIGGASRNGILIKGSMYLEKFNKVNIFVFDKTGTLTKGNFEVASVDGKDTLKYAAIAEYNSNHPIATSIKKAYGSDVDTNYELTDVSGKGVVAKGEHIILCGNHKLMEEYNISYNINEEVGTIIYVACDNKYIGSIVIRDEIKEDAKEMISYLNSIGAKTIMLTGDNEKIASYVAKELGISEYKSSLLPQDKVSNVDSYLENKQKNDYLSFVGDGINDAPVLMKSDIGISMGNIGSDAAIEASDIVLMYDDLKSISIAKKIAKKTMRIVIENIIFAIGIKLLILLCSALGLFGNMTMWLAVFGDVGVAVICILNSMRCNTNYKKKSS